MGWLLFIGLQHEKEHKMSEYQTPEDALWWSSAAYRREVEQNETYSIGVVKHVPTDLEKVSKAEIDEMMGGYDEKKICPNCNMALSKSGACTGFCFD
jgi:hypothetical protein